MQFLELVRLDCIQVPLNACSWQEAIKQLTDLLERAQQLQPDEHFAARAVAREEKASTHLFPGLAFPHEASFTAQRPCLAIGKLRQAARWPGPGGEQVSLVFLFVVPEGQPAARLRIMQELYELFQDDAVLSQLHNAETSLGLYELLVHADRDRNVPRGFHLKTLLRGHVDLIHSVTWSPDGMRLASGGAGKDECRVWDGEHGRLIAVLKGHAGPLFSVAWSPQGRLLASGGADSILRLWSAEEGFALRQSLNTYAEIYSVAWSPDGRTLASAGHRSMGRLWDAETGAPKLGIESGFNLGYCIRWSPDGQWLAAGGGRMDPSVWIWNAATGGVQVHKQVRNGSVFALAWSPDGRTLAAAAADGAVVIYEAGTWQERTTLRGHTGQPTAVDFSCDGRLLASKADDGTVRLWDAANWEQVAQLSEPGAVHRLFNGLAFHPQRPELATLGEGGKTVRIWQLDYDELLAAARQPSYRVPAKPAPTADTLEQKRLAGQFDVFLCHNAEDKPAVMEIGRRLLDRGILPWLDEWEVPPGCSWLAEIQDQIGRIRSAAVFVGPNGIGPWQDKEVRALIQRLVTSDCRCIPVVLANCTELPELPLFLKDVRWVDFGKPDCDPLTELIWGITGRKPLER